MKYYFISLKICVYYYVSTMYVYVCVCVCVISGSPGELNEELVT